MTPMGSDKVYPDDVGPGSPRLTRERTFVTPIQRWPSSFAAEDKGSEALGTDECGDTTRGWAARDRLITRDALNRCIPRQ